MDLYVSSRDAASSFDELLDRVTAGGTIVIERDGLPVAKLVSADPTPKQVGRILTAADIAAVNEALRSLDDDWADAVEEAVRIGNQPMTLEDPWER